MVPGPFIMFFNSHGKHTRSEMSGEFGPFRGGAQGDEQRLGMTWHCARVKEMGSRLRGQGGSVEVILMPGGQQWVVDDPGQQTGASSMLAAT